MADILNKTSEIGKYPENVHLGTPNPLAKPRKTNEKVNVRPIILLSPLRKILTMSLIDRCWDRMKKQILWSQASYQSGRSTIEQGSTIKTLADKNSENYDIFLLLLDMPKAFDNVYRKELMNILGSILTKCELHVIHVLINDVILNVILNQKLIKLREISTTLVTEAPLLTEGLHVNESKM